MNERLGDRQGFWDDEIDQLAQQVSDVFGEDVLNEAVDRALASFRSALDRDVAEGIDVVDVPAKMRGALKATLRALLTPH